MSIRTRLLTLFMPLLLVFIIALSILYYFNWKQEIIEITHKKLESVVSSAAVLSKSPHQLNQLTALQILEKKLELLDLYATDKLEKDIPLNENTKNRLLQDKESVVTPIYHKPGSSIERITAIAPIINSDGSIAGFVIADADSKTLSRSLNEALSLLLVSVALSTVVVTCLATLIAHLISKPVRQLKNVALAIAAGEYGRSIEIKGPKELVELASTLNTMSECLQENVIQLTENALQREQQHSEYDCCLLLQNQMLHAADNKMTGPFYIRTIDLQANPLTAVKLNIDQKENLWKISWSEAVKPGFNGMYDLLTNCANTPFLNTQMVFDGLDQSLRAQEFGLPSPIVWLTQKKQAVVVGKDPVPLQNGDLIFLYNTGLVKLLENHEMIIQWLTRTLRHFGHEGIQNFGSLLEKELHYVSRKLSLKKDVHLIAFQVHL
ncbi:MAG: HAMP domain-containing protein [Parachlamydiales bacterium]|nr:HAMP domain-containing protein [Parachlamydiales bacterium]